MFKLKRVISGRNQEPSAEFRDGIRNFCVYPWSVYKTLLEKGREVRPF